MSAMQKCLRGCRLWCGDVYDYWGNVSTVRRRVGRRNALPYTQDCACPRIGVPNSEGVGVSERIDPQGRASEERLVSVHVRQLVEA